MDRPVVPVADADELSGIVRPAQRARMDVVHVEMQLVATLRDLATPLRSSLCSCAIPRGGSRGGRRGLSDALVGGGGIHLARMSFCVSCVFRADVVSRAM